MPAIYAIVVVGWVLLLAVFAWLHRPQPTMAEIIRTAESRS